MKYILCAALGLFFGMMKSVSQDSNKVPTITPDLAGMPNTTLVYYDITGSTETELREQMNRLRPKSDKDTARYDALTEWIYQWGWPGYGTTKCDLSQATVSFKITVTLPRWVPPPNASVDLITKWEKYMRALIAHEKGHVDNVVAHYSTVLTSIKNANCYTAEDSIDMVIKRIQKQEEFYDAITNHGTSRGAVFP